MTEVRVPALGESVTEATIATWFKKIGDLVAMDEMLCELETDKVTVEIPSPVNGILSEIISLEGLTVEVNSLLARITETKGSDRQEQSGEQKNAAIPQPTQEKVDSSPEQTPREQVVNKDVENAPSANKLMAENKLSKNTIEGTGRNGRVMKEDVMRVLEFNKASAVTNKISAIKPDRPNPSDREERVKMTRLRQTIASRLKESQNTAAMLTTYNEVDMTEVIDLRSSYKEAFQRKHGVKLGFMSFFTKACCAALLEVPEVNAEIDQNYIIYKKYVHMGIAAGTPSGLVVPVIRNADSMSFAELETAISEKSSKARQGALSIGDLQGGSFTISNGGVYGSLMSSPILNPPQSGILGMHKIQDRPVAIDGEVKIRPMMYLALSYDHRIVDGKGAVTFLIRVKEALENPLSLLIDL
ncbi:MAG: 2-oxoglutarate dehydrogenase complex dihydrolipoyllysine-residue succinyltransferase [Proteobacteria bacterium]|jgi:2-oxoglutarate dehydrogenase E2 component (dihydrolipoamide succinyltransferase)|nr:2-oxoglutarate dehydrogenase complex dihydrolipoyllysine-residue succinyltransferase [Pseudomonadota bacterium]